MTSSRTRGGGSAASQRNKPPRSLLKEPFSSTPAHRNSGLGMARFPALSSSTAQVEWRLDPASGSRVPQATDHEVRVIVICHQGYSSSLAAASLQDLGLVNATDVIGGFEAWKAAGLPVKT